ncbi:omega-scoloptoxin-Ssm1a-like isoform X1 [Pomacea canaliculata]|uniref:omega-scoloptoxin-Ssm1a-like isoform X1 n=1 Tax=Pomacea canaliculata TaxID=400727 RepID=UPI000D730792|nr:omega-scoloptoxin-Ssm1a-like isoform X1 [Pomacea canaliculata]
MASAHHLLAAAFSLCGLLFLLHVVTVNSIVCKNCNSNDAGCLSGNVPEGDCGANNRCRTTIVYYKNGNTQVTFRGCENGKEDQDKCTDFDDRSECDEYCNTDNCNKDTYGD